MTQLPTISSYGHYSSSNYGAHTLQVNIPRANRLSLTVYFSYQTPVAFTHPEEGLVVHENIWGPTTGKHLNWIDGGNKKARVSESTFAALYEEAMQEVDSMDPLLIGS